VTASASPVLNRPARARLTRDRVIRAAVELVDRQGVEALTMRRLGSSLGVEAMSLYKHVRNKEAILDGIVEQVVAEIGSPADPLLSWQEALRHRAVASRQVLRAHPWAIGLLESRRPLGPGQLRSLDAALGNLRSAGFAIEEAARALWLVDGFVYGQVVQETSQQLASSAEAAPAAEETLAQLAASGYRYLDEIAQRALASPFSVDEEFDFGLRLILDALEGRRSKGRTQRVIDRPRTGPGARR
jgi:AcrR family transcriptional regulator